VSGVGSSSNVYEVAIEGTNPLRRLVDVPLLNGAVNVGDLTTLASRADNSTPRFLARPTASLNIDGIFLNPGGNVSTPVQIISITNPGTSGAIVSARKLLDNGDLDRNADLLTGIIPIPNPEFVITGDKGIFFSTSVLSTTPTVPGSAEQKVGRFFFSNRQNFLKFS
jgi:hypothetical protein